MFSKENAKHQPPVQKKEPVGNSHALTPPPFQLAADPMQQKSEEKEENPSALQMKTGSGPTMDTPPADAGGNGSLPANLQAKAASTFGQDMSGVQVNENSSQASEMGALAYAQGNTINFAPGQYNPSSSQGQELIGHELGHVVQQSQNRVQPTTQAKGNPVNDDKGLESEADAMGAKFASAGSEKVAAGGTAQKKDSGQISAGPVQKKDDPATFFPAYEQQTQAILDFTYSKSNTWKKYKSNHSDLILTGKDFADAAKAVYDAADTKDLKRIPPAEIAVAQAMHEGGLKPPSEDSDLAINPFNVAKTDGGNKKGSALHLDNIKKDKGWKAARTQGVINYYKLMYSKFMPANNRPEDMLEYDSFNQNGDTKYSMRYATAFYYEAKIASTVGLMHMNRDNKMLSGSVGGSKGNAAPDLKAVYKYIQSYDKYPGKRKPDTKYAAMVKLEGGVPTKESLHKALYAIQQHEILPAESTFTSSKKAIAERMKTKHKADYQQQVDSRKGGIDGVASKHGTTIGYLYYYHELVTQGHVFESPDGKTEGTKTKTKAKASGAGSVLKGSGGLDFEGIAKQVWYAMFGGISLGTDEKKVYDNLAKLKNDSDNIAQFKAVYTKKYNSDVIADIKSEFSNSYWWGNQLDKALGYLNTDGAGNAGKKAGSAVKKAAQTQSGTITASALNVRSGPGTGHKTVGSALKQGASVSILEKKDGWFKIGQGKWVFGKYVKVAGGTKTNTGSPADVAVVAKPKTKSKTETHNNGHSNVGDFKLSASVGKGGANIVSDIKQVQDLLVALDYMAAGDAEVKATTEKMKTEPDGKFEESELTNTIKAIYEYQKLGATKRDSKNTKTTWKGDGNISKRGGTATSMGEMARINDQYGDNEIKNDDIANVLSNSQWRSQFRFGRNYRDGDDTKETAYCKYVKEVTGFSEAGDLVKAPADQQKKVKDKYGSKDWFDRPALKDHNIKTSEKARDSKPNYVCCWDTAGLMLGFSGASEKGANHKIQTFVQDIDDGKWTNQVEMGIQYIDGQLNSGKAVFIGIDKGKTKSHNEATTDHYILIVGKHKDGDKVFYEYFDPGTSYKSSGVNSKTNRLYIGSDNKTVKNDKKGYKLSQVRVNNE